MKVRQVLIGPSFQPGDQYRGGQAQRLRRLCPRRGIHYPDRGRGLPRPGTVIDDREIAEVEYSGWFSHRVFHVET